MELTVKFFHFNLRVILNPTKMMTIPPRHYCIIENPVLLDKNSTRQLISYKIYFIYLVKIFKA